MAKVAKDDGKVIIGVYHANEHISNTTMPASIGTIAEKIVSYEPLTCVLIVSFSCMFIFYLEPYLSFGWKVDNEGLASEENSAIRVSIRPSDTNICFVDACNWWSSNVWP